MFRSVFHTFRNLLWVSGSREDSFWREVSVVVIPKEDKSAQVSVLPGRDFSIPVLLVLILCQCCLLRHFYLTGPPPPSDPDVNRYPSLTDRGPTALRTDACSTRGIVRCERRPSGSPSQEIHGNIAEDLEFLRGLRSNKRKAIQFLFKMATRLFQTGMDCLIGRKFFVKFDLVCFY